MTAAAWVACWSAETIRPTMLALLGEWRGVEVTGPLRQRGASLAAATHTSSGDRSPTDGFSSWEQAGSSRSREAAGAER